MVAEQVSRCAACAELRRKKVSELEADIREADNVVSISWVQYSTVFAQGLLSWLLWVECDAHCKQCA